jgi:hypothetical protein
MVDFWAAGCDHFNEIMQELANALALFHYLLWFACNC